MKLSDLKTGNVIKSDATGDEYIVTHNYSRYVTAVASVDIKIPGAWVLVNSESGSPVKIKSIMQLRAGNTVKRANENGVYVITGNYGDRCTACTTLDLSGNTELRLNFTSPDGAIEFQRTNPQVTAPVVDSPSLPNVGILPANTYMAYFTQETDFAMTGDWVVCATYVDGTPKTRFGQKTVLTVLEGC